MGSLNESEKRFLAAVDRLAKASTLMQGQKTHVQKLEGENKILANGLAQLKADYQALEKAFGDLKTHVETREFIPASGGATSDQEVKALKDQLKALQNDRNEMERAFSKLKRQHADALESMSATPMFPFGTRDSVQDGAKMDEFKNALRDRLDMAIERLERLSA